MIEKIGDLILELRRTAEFISELEADLKFTHWWRREKRHGLRFKLESRIRYYNRLKEILAVLVRGIA